jgi:hypothetical protein
VDAQWRRWWGCADSQEVGLEAAILERVRNSSLVECPRADNMAGLKHPPEAADRVYPRGGVYGRGAFVSAEKLERKHQWSGAKRECRNE